MRVSIVQLTCNSSRDVREKMVTVEQLVANDARVDEWLVLDNGSSDDTVDELDEIAARRPELTVFSSPRNLGCGGGRDRLWREATGEFILSLDSDVELLDLGCLDRMIEDLSRPGIGIVGQAGGWVRKDWSWTLLAEPDYRGPVPIVCGFAQLFRRELVTTWVYRPEYGPYWLDDSEFCLQTLEGRGLGGWLGYYGIRHAWAHTNGTSQTERARAWLAFRNRWRPAKLPVSRDSARS